MAEETQESSTEKSQILDASAAQYETALAHIEQLQEQVNPRRIISNLKMSTNEVFSSMA